MQRVVSHPDTYLDSVLLLKATRAMHESPGVDYASAVMATPANLAQLAEEGFSDPALDRSSANDLVLIVRAKDAAGADAAIDAGERALFGREGSGDAPAEERRAQTVQEAKELLGAANVAVISVPGPYAALETHKAMSAGLDVLLFSDNVPLEEERELKERAEALGRLVMGPGAGTAMLGGCGLGFSNAVRRGPVGVVAAAGTGAQEVMCLLDQWGTGVSQVIGVGGRDLTEAVGGRMARSAVAALDADPSTEIILLVSKPPSATVARSVVDAAQSTPIVAALPGLQDTLDLGEGAEVTSGLEAGALVTLRHLGLEAPDLVGDLEQAVRTRAEHLDAERLSIRGLFSGGTLCYEALTLLGAYCGSVYSNIAVDERYRAEPPAGAHLLLDLGEEEYTKGRPHPMIDPEARMELLESTADDPTIAVVMLDVVIGYGAHSDPASVFAPTCATLQGDGGPVVVAYVLGTASDPQGLDRQRRALAEAGCLVAPTATRASLAAAAVATRRPELVRERC